MCHQDTCVCYMCVCLYGGTGPGCPNEVCVCSNYWNARSPIGVRHRRLRERVCGTEGPHQTGGGLHLEVRPRFGKMRGYDRVEQAFACSAGIEAVQCGLLRGESCCTTRTKRVEQAFACSTRVRLERDGRDLARCARVALLLPAAQLLRLLLLLACRIRLSGWPWWLS